MANTGSKAGFISLRAPGTCPKVDDGRPIYQAIVGVFELVMT
jgi:hypothetical protein